MQISRVEIDVLNRRKMSKLTHVGAYHSWVENSFPAEVAGGVRTRKLWRIDAIGDKRYLIVLSQKAPDLDILESFGVKGTAETKCYDHFLDDIKSGEKMRFRISLNPCITKSAGKGHRGKTMPHVTAEHQLQYFLDRAERMGFRLERLDPNFQGSNDGSSSDFNSNLAALQCSIVERSTVVFKKPECKRPIRFIKVTYEGTLIVENQERFVSVLKNGYGKHKAYGFGLMTVMPLS